MARQRGGRQAVAFGLSSSGTGGYFWGTLAFVSSVSCSAHLAVTEFEAFRANVLEAVDRKPRVFAKPICEVCLSRNKGACVCVCVFVCVCGVCVECECVCLVTPGPVSDLCPRFAFAKTAKTTASLFVCPHVGHNMRSSFSTKSISVRLGGSRLKEAGKGLALLCCRCCCCVCLCLFDWLPPPPFCVHPP